MKHIAILAVAVLAGAGATAAQSVQDDELFPPNAQPGECYTRVFVPPTYETMTQEMLVKEASARVEIVPARYETVEETLLIKEASSRLEVVPATYDWVEDTVMVKPERTVLVEVPARYETTSEQVLDTPAHTVWKRGRGPIETVDNSTGEIMCLIEVPATYKTVTKRVLANPATTQEKVIPAEYTTVKKRKMAQPPTTRSIEIPAEYDTVRVTKLVEAPKTLSHEIPAEYKTITSKKKVTEGMMAWRSVLCETNTTPNVVTRIQRALRDQGYNPGPIDGNIGSDTMAAVRSFQSSKGLPVGALTMETLKALGL